MNDVESAMGGKGSMYAPKDIRYGIRDFSDPLQGKKGSGGIRFVEEDKEGDKEGVKERAGRRAGRGGGVDREMGRRGGGKVVGERENMSVVGVERDLSGDGGVLKTITAEGKGAVVAGDAKVRVSYIGRLEKDGSKFDASSDRDDKGFEFVLGKGKVIRGWDIAIATMRLGEKATLKIGPAYAYGTRGVPPVIPSKATLIFDVELLEASDVQDKVPQTVAGYNPGIPRTPEDITAAYEKKMEEKKKQGKKSWLEQIYIISPFASETGEKPPWYLNPNITFFIVFAIVGASFWLVYQSGGIHQGFVESVDTNIFK